MILTPQHVIVRTEDRLRLSARLASERSRLLEEEKRENDLKSKIENEAILREQKRSRVPESGGAVRLKFVLPKGQSFTYSFTPETDVSIIRDTIDVKIEDEDWGIRNYELVSRSERKKVRESVRRRLKAEYRKGWILDLGEMGNVCNVMMNGRGDLLANMDDPFIVTRERSEQIGEGKIGEWCQGGVIMIADLDA